MQSLDVDWSVSPIRLPSRIEEYESSIEILRTSLKLNPGDPTLINNLAFANKQENWHALYKAALLELDLQKMPERVGQARARPLLVLSASA